MLPILLFIFLLLSVDAFHLLRKGGVRNIDVVTRVNSVDRLPLSSSSSSNVQTEDEDALKKGETPFLTSLLNAQAKTTHRFFFPGHGGQGQLLEEGKDSKRLNLFDHDLPELHETDNLHSPEGPLKESMVAAAKLYGAARSWYLVNGSTSGILIAILATCRIFDMKFPQKRNTKKMIVARNSHKSVYDALELAQCNALLLPVSYCNQFHVPIDISFDSIVNALQKHNTEICGIVLTRPSYHGIALSSNELKRIVDLAHNKYGVPVIVDEAHGAHLRFLEMDTLQDAMACGVDVSIQSTHKTLTSLSQTAMLHVNSHAYDSKDKQELIPIMNVYDEVFSMLTTTSPNAVLLASLDMARSKAFKEAEKIRDTARLVDSLRQKITIADNACKLLEDSADIKERLENGLVTMDPLRLSVQFEGKESSIDVDEIMCEGEGIYCELNEKFCITYAIPPYTSMNSSSLNTLSKSLLSLPVSFSGGRNAIGEPAIDPSIALRMDPDSEWANEALGFYDDDDDDDDDSGNDDKMDIMKITKIVNSEFSYLNMEKRSSSIVSIPVDNTAVSHVSTETICAYPPGVPILLSGEYIDRKHIDALIALRNAQRIKGISLLPCSDPELNSISVYKKDNTSSSSSSSLLLKNNNANIEQDKGAWKSHSLIRKVSRYFKDVVNDKYRQKKEIPNVVKSLASDSVTYVNDKFSVGRLKRMMTSYNWQALSSPPNFFLTLILISSVFSYINDKMKSLRIGGRIARMIRTMLNFVFISMNLLITVIFNGFR